MPRGEVLMLSTGLLIQTPWGQHTLSTIWTPMGDRYLQWGLCIPTLGTDACSWPADHRWCKSFGGSQGWRRGRSPDVWWTWMHRWNGHRHNAWRLLSRPESVKRSAELLFLYLWSANVGGGLQGFYLFDWIFLPVSMWRLFGCKLAKILPQASCFQTQECSVLWSQEHSFHISALNIWYQI